MSQFQTIIGSDVTLAGQYLQKGEAVGIPTETVYGLAANALNQDAVLKIFEIKDRPHFDPLIVHVYSGEQIAEYAEFVPEAARRLLASFSPGPLTIILKKR